MLKSDRVFCLLLLNLLIRFSCGDQIALNEKGDEGEAGNPTVGDTSLDEAHSQQPRETVDDKSGEQKREENDQKESASPEQRDAQKEVSLTPDNEPKIEKQTQEEAQIETNEGSEISTKTQSSDDTNSGQSGKGSQVLRKVDSSQEEQSKDTTHIDSENKDERGPEVKAETFMAEGEGRLEPGTEAEQSRPVQPDGSSSHTEVLTTTPEPEVNEEGKGIETFSEWRQKALAEEEKNKQKAEVLEQGVTTPKKQNGKKVNYASKECGAKILASNPEAENVNRILTSNRDDYMINPCTASKKWFVIELCEPIYVNEIEAGSYELFSSQPHNFSVNVSDRYPAKEYHSLGVFELTESRGLDKFPIKREHNYFVKYMKVELLTHYGEEHYCPLTMFRVYGIPVELDGEDDDLEGEQSGDNMEASENTEGTDSNQPKNLFSSAKDTVMKLVKKVLNVEEKEEKLQLNTSLPLNATSNNVTDTKETDSSEKMKPCEPTAIVPKEKCDDRPVKTDPSQPEPPMPTSCPAHQKKPCGIPGTATDEMKPDLLDPAVSIVTKLEDHEQIPSEPVKPPLVSLIQSGDHTKPTTLYRMFLSCILPSRFKIRKRPNSTLSMCGYVMALRPQWFCVPGEFTLHSTCVSRSISHEPSIVAPSDQVDENPEEDIKVSITPTSDVVKTSAEDEGESQSPCFVPTPASTVDSQMPTVTQTPPAESDSPVQEGKVTPQETEAEQQEPPPSPVLSTSLNTMDKTETAEVKVTASVPVEKTQTVEVPPAVESTTSTDVDFKSSQPVLEPSVAIEVNTDSISETPQLPQAETLTTSPVDMETSLPAASSSADDSRTEQKMHLPEVNLASISTSNSVQMESSVENTAQNGQINEEDDEQTVGGARDSQTAPDVSDTPETQSDTKPESSFALSEDEIEYTPQKNLRLAKVPIMPLQKRETAIMRLTNRIKALETNVSLSSRFLDEMTQKFKRQSEEMQKLLSAKFENVTKDLKDAERRDHHQQEQINVLEHRLDNLTDLVYKLHDEMFNLNKQVIDRQLYFTSVEVFVLVCVLLLCRRRGKTSVTDMPPEVRRLIERVPVTMDVSHSPRRNSYTEGASRKQNKMLTVGTSLQKHSSETSLAKRYSKKKEEKKEQNTIFQIHRNPKFAKRVELCQHREPQ
nr:SUN domain-containing ossification factor-like isoform X2 [Crassostrea gigas]